MARICPTPKCVSSQFTDDEEKWCPVCGQEIIEAAQECRQCGRHVERFQNFCKYCGLSTRTQDKDPTVHAEYAVAGLTEAFGLTDPNPHNPVGMVFAYGHLDCPICRSKGDG